MEESEDEDLSVSVTHSLSVLVILMPNGATIHYHLFH